MADHGLRVTVNSQYLPDHSDPAQRRWFFAYRVRILNEGALPAQVQRRHWIITNGKGDVEEVEGEGVVGATPWLPPSAAFEYTSYCPLGTASGMMSGSLLCTRDNGENFSVTIPPFELLSEQAYVH